MAIIVCGNFANEACFSTTGNDADNWRLTGLDMRQKSGIGNTGAMVKTGSESETTSANTPNNIEIDHNWLEATQAGTVRGIFVNGRNINIHDNYVSGFRNSGQECQAILLAGGPGPVTIDNNYMMALGEVFMSGGLTVGIMPGDLTFTRNYLEAPQKYNPWNPSVFDTSDVQGTTNLTVLIAAPILTLCRRRSAPAAMLMRRRRSRPLPETGAALAEAQRCWQRPVILLALVLPEISR
jgi:hypothetical protein